MKQRITQIRSSVRLLDIIFGVAASSLIIFGLWHQTHPAAGANQCRKVGTKYTVMYKNNSFQPNALYIRRCDVVSIVNSSKDYVEPIFGTHEHHIAYTGYQHQAVAPNEYLNIDAVQAGSFVIHDHINDTARLELTIK